MVQQKHFKNFHLSINVIGSFAPATIKSDREYTQMDNNKLWQNSTRGFIKRGKRLVGAQRKENLALKGEWNPPAGVETGQGDSEEKSHVRPSIGSI